MKRPKFFSFCAKFGENNRTLRLVGQISPYYPAVMYLRNGDPGYPAEGGEIEDCEVSVVHTRKDGRKVERKIEAQGKLWEAIQERIYEHAWDYGGF